jgi:anaerobic magnesium-protoporphyrin IX monomethyl ester cyclase
MPDILLIQPPIRDFYLTAKRTLPYGLARIAATLRRAGFTVAICDGLASSKSRIIPWPQQMGYLVPYYGRADLSPFGLFHHYRHFGYSLEHMARQAKTSGAWLIGISSLFTAYSDIALETAAAVKKACPGIPIVLGGHHPTALPEAVIGHPAVDYILRGDGEEGFPALARAIRQGTSLKGVPGLVRRRSDGTLSKAPPAVVNDLDALPVPAFDLIAWRHYQRAGRGSLAMTASSGCPLRCTYCAVNASGYHGFRQRSVESVISELKAAFDIRPMGFIDFEDEHLGADKAWTLDFLTRIREVFGQWKPELRAMNGLFAPHLDDPVIEKMRQAGFKSLNLALITKAVSQLKRFARPDIRRDFDRVLDLARRYAMDCVAYLIVAGPEQDPFASVDDLVYLAERRVLAGVSVFYPAPGSRDFDWCRRKQLLPDDPMLMRSTALPLVHRTDRDQTVTLLRLGRLLNFMKKLIDRGEAMPLPERAPKTIDPKTDRMAIGKRLLAAFLRDGVIRGVDPEGRVYRHTLDVSLARRFLSACRKIRIKGAKA